MYHQRGEVWKWILVIVGIGVIGWFFWSNQQPESSGDWMELMEEEMVEVEDESGRTGQKIGVHAAGAVKRPGVYFLKSDARVVDLLKAAGGVSKDAELNQINLAAPLVDGQKIVVPDKVVQISGNYMEHSFGSSSPSDGKVSLNNGSKEELMTLSGIGPSKATAIIEYREDNGPFHKLEDILKVQGIGDKTFERLKSQLTLY